MRQPELKTQIFYLNRIFEILSDGYMLSVISFHETGLNGDENLPFSIISDDQKRNVQQEQLEGILNSIFIELYNHTKQFTSAPQIFIQDWNNEFVLKSIGETQKNILEYIKSNEVIIKTSHHITEDDIQVIELIDEEKQNKEVIFFQKWFH